MFTFRVCKAGYFSVCLGRQHQLSAVKSQLLRIYVHNQYSQKGNYMHTSKPNRQEKSQEPERKPGITNKDLGYLIFGMVSTTAAFAILMYKTWQRESKQPRRKLSRINLEDTHVKEPSNSEDIPDKIPYLLIGGGTSSFSAFRAIKSNDPTAKVLVISEESYLPYMRPPLSKEMWFSDIKSVTSFNFKQWNGTERSLFYEPEEFYVSCDSLLDSRKGGVAVARGWTVTSVDPEKKVAILDDGKKIQYGKCLIATGSYPKSLSVFENDDIDFRRKVTLYHGLDSFKKVHRATLAGAKTIAVVGGGVLGSELASSLALREKVVKPKLDIIQITDRKGILSDILPEYLSIWSTNKLRDQGIDINCNTEVTKATLSPNKKKLILTLTSGKKITVDHVVVAEGAEPDTELAESSNLETDPELGGFVVNPDLSIKPNLYCAGDCASFFDSHYGKRRVVLNHDNAVVSGRLAGENMVGAGKPFQYQPMFWSDLGPDISYEGVGIIDSSLPTVGVFAKSDDNASESVKKNNSSTKTAESDSLLTTSNPKEGEEYSKGVIFYLQDDIIVGIVLWNLFSRLPVARQILKERKKYDDLNEVAKLFDIHAGGDND